VAAEEDQEPGLECEAMQADLQLISAFISPSILPLPLPSPFEGDWLLSCLLSFVHSHNTHDEAFIAKLNEINLL
jgi:hypothetical protein